MAGTIRKVAIHNNIYHAVTKSSPSKLLFGFEQRRHSDASLAEFTRKLAKIDRNLQEERDLSRNMAHKATELIRFYNKDYRDARLKKVTKYAEGDYVMIRNTRVKPGKGSKLKAKYVGPYLIKKSSGNNRYVVADIPGFNLTQKPLDTILSCDRLKPLFRYEPPKNGTDN